jgi:protein SCO1/2
VAKVEHQFKWGLIDRSGKVLLEPQFLITRDPEQGIFHDGMALAVRDDKFGFVNQDGDTVTQQQTAGKVYIANYFFVTCTGICPVMNSNVHKVYDALQEYPDLLILSHTCQPEVDTVPLLKHYADSIGIDSKRWQFLTGNKLELYTLARDSYKIDDPQNNVGNMDDQFLHSQFLALVDKKGQVRGVYDGLKKKEVDQLIEDYQLVKKEAGSGNFVNNIFGNAPAR